MSFLKAEWNNLALLNYDVNPEILKPYIPNGTELDYWNDKCYISLVGFMFENVKLLGLKIPFHTHFEEVNLRFYVKRFENNEWKRGVVFIKEIVPKPALTFFANTIYKEHYETLPIFHSVNFEREDKRLFTYGWKKQNFKNSFTLITETELSDIETQSEAEFITEHYFGYTKTYKGTYEYEVKHPRWQQYKVKNYFMNIDFKSTYGDTFEFLEKQRPISIILAKGSKISVENKKLITL
jgi:uncharacterized protein YqjF (DUF2071 family)